MKLDTLYKKNSGGTLQQWDIWTEGPTIITEFGQVGGAIQRTEDTIKLGKNVGKKNETSPDKQAEAEAESCEPHQTVPNRPRPQRTGA